MKAAELQHRALPNQSAALQKGGAAMASFQSGKLTQLEALIDASPAMLTQRKLINTIANSAFSRAQSAAPLQAKLATLQRLDDEDEKLGTAQRAVKEEELDLSAQSTAQLQEASTPRANNTGLPDNLKSGIETLSGIAMDNVKVHYNSPQPAQLNALAYAQGSDIHVAPGQEQHLPHEAWHVVQQAQGRVKPTLQMKAGVNVNDDKGLEAEADVMGDKAVSVGQITAQEIGSSDSLPSLSPPAQKVAQRAELASDKLNVAGEDHDESGARRNHETAYATAMTGGGYWREHEFKVSDVSEESADDFVLRAKQLIAFAKKANFSKWLDVKTETLVGGLIAKIIDDKIFENSVLLFRPKELELYKNYIPSAAYDKYTDTLLTNSSVFEECISSIKTSLAEYIKTKDLRYKELLVEAVGVFQLIFGVLSIQIDQVTEALDIISSEDVSRQRSEKMHAAANNRSGTKGLWKIGDMHAADMLAMAPKTYHHLRRADFNSGFNLFVARRAAMVKITTLANGNWGPYTTGISSRPKGVSAISDIITNAGNSPAKTVLSAIKVRATADSTRDSSHRHQKTTDFYAALSAMDVDNLVSLNAIPGLMDGINL